MSFPFIRQGGLSWPLLHRIQETLELLAHPRCRIESTDLDAELRYRARRPWARHATVLYRTSIIHTRHRKVIHPDWLATEATDVRSYWWEVHRHHHCEQGRCAACYVVVECDDHLDDARAEKIRYPSFHQAVREADAWNAYYRNLFARMDRQE